VSRNVCAHGAPAAVRCGWRSRGPAFREVQNGSICGIPGRRSKRAHADERASIRARISGQSRRLPRSGTHLAPLLAVRQCRSHPARWRKPSNQLREKRLEFLGPRHKVVELLTNPPQPSPQTLCQVTKGPCGYNGSPRESAVLPYCPLLRSHIEEMSATEMIS